MIDPEESKMSLGLFAALAEPQLHGTFSLKSSCSLHDRSRSLIQHRVLPMTDKH